MLVGFFRAQYYLRPQFGEWLGRHPMYILANFQLVTAMLIAGVAIMMGYATYVGAGLGAGVLTFLYLRQIPPMQRLAAEKPEPRGWRLWTLAFLMSLLLPVVGGGLWWISVRQTAWGFYLFGWLITDIFAPLWLNLAALLLNPFENHALRKRITRALKAHPKVTRGGLLGRRRHAHQVQVLENVLAPHHQVAVLSGSLLHIQQQLEGLMNVEKDLFLFDLCEMPRGHWKMLPNLIPMDFWVLMEEPNPSVYRNWRKFSPRQKNAAPLLVPAELFLEAPIAQASPGEIRLFSDGTLPADFELVSHFPHESGGFGWQLRDPEDRLHVVITPDENERNLRAALIQLGIRYIVAPQSLASTPEPATDAPEDLPAPPSMPLNDETNHDGAGLSTT